MKFQADLNRNIEEKFVTEPSKESVCITPQCSLGKSALIDMSEKRTDYIDSLFKERVADYTKQQICAILNWELKHIKIDVLCLTTAK